MKVQIGDILYNKKEESWHDDSFDGEWHKVQKFEKFIVINILDVLYSKKLMIHNIEKNYDIYMNYVDLEYFYNKIEYRKIKLQKIGKETRNI
jgi:hypothetical protein